MIEPDPARPGDHLGTGVVLGCDELGPCLDFFVERLGFLIEMITPADSPRLAVLTGHGLRVVLDTGREAISEHPTVLRLPRSSIEGGDGAPAAPEVVAPNGTIIEWVDHTGGPLRLGPAAPRFELSRADGAFGSGRAAMAYRDLLPERQGGRYIASHIRIAEAGPVPDWVHHHRIRFQLIWCRRGWVRVVYEDQGEPFVLEAGDGVLQPPGIRHRVLESSAGLEVVEIGCPAEHETLADRSLDLPNERVEVDRRFDGQRFVRHVAADTPWTVVEGTGRRERDLGIAAATAGLADVRVVAATGPAGPPIEADPGSEFHFFFVDRGAATLERSAEVAGGAETIDLGPGDAVALDPGADDRIVSWTDEFEALQVIVAAMAD